VFAEDKVTKESAGLVEESILGGEKREKKVPGKSDLAGNHLGDRGGEMGDGYTKGWKWGKLLIVFRESRGGGGPKGQGKMRKSRDNGFRGKVTKEREVGAEANTAVVRFSENAPIVSKRTAPERTREQAPRLENFKGRLEKRRNKTKLENVGNKAS